MSKQFPKKTTQAFSYPFAIETFGLYSIAIIAESNKADLRVEIDDIKLREIPPEKKPQYNNIPPSWNGSKLKGASKTVIFVCTLNKGDHTIHFIPTGQVVVENFSIQKIDNPANITFALETQAQSLERQPWITIALIDLPLHAISVQASIDWHRFDGDDIKLIVDNTIKTNSSSILHKNWAWSADPVQVFTPPKREKKTFVEDLPKAVHYIELWADQSPILHSIDLDIGDFMVKRTPTKNDPEWTGDFWDDPDLMILARVLFGEARSQLVPDSARVAIGWVIKNRVKSPRWPDTYHEVITEPLQYSAFNENDHNRPFVEHPLSTGNTIDQKAWDHTYDIAQQIIEGKVKDPTNGANHYYDDSIDTPVWAKDIEPTLTISYKNQYGNTATIYFLKL